MSNHKKRYSAITWQEVATAWSEWEDELGIRLVVELRAQRRRVGEVLDLRIGGTVTAYRGRDASTLAYLVFDPGLPVSPPAVLLALAQCAIAAEEQEG